MADTQMALSNGTWGRHLQVYDSVGTSSALVGAPTGRGGLALSANAGRFAVELLPPSGEPFVAGPYDLAQVDPGADRPADAATLSVVRGRLGGCLGPILPGGRLHVSEAAYDESGGLTRLDAWYVASCRGPYGPAGEVTGFVRFGEDAPYAVVSAIGGTVRVPAGRTGSAALVLTNLGTGPVTLAAGVDPIGTDVGDVRVVDNGCDESVAAGADCVIRVELTATAVGWANARLALTSPEVPYGGAVLPLLPVGLGAPTIPDIGHTAEAYDGVALDWTGATTMERPVTGYRVYRRDASSEDWVLVGDLPWIRRSLVDAGYLRPGQAAEYRVGAVNEAGETLSEAVTLARGTDQPGEVGDYRLLVADGRGSSGVARGADLVLKALGDPFVTAVGMPPLALWVGRIPDGPGSYRVPDDLASQPGALPSPGTLIVRQALFRADGTPLLLDADYIPDSGYPASYVRVGTAGALVSAIGLTPHDDFGTVEMSLTPRRRQVSVTNTGDAPLAVGTPRIEAATGSRWTVSDSCPASLPSGQACTVEVSGRPTRPGTFTADLIIPSSTRPGAHTVSLIGIAVDTRAPTTVMTAPGRPFNVTSAQVGYPGDDGGGVGVADHDVRYRWAADTSRALSAYVNPVGWRGIGNSGDARHTALLTAGREYCYSARARDRLGHLGPWSIERCTAAYRDDRALTRKTLGWQRTFSFPSLDHQVLSTRTEGAKLTRQGIHAKRVALLVNTCPRCGRAEVWIGATRLGVVNTYSARRHYRVTKLLPVSRTLLSGTLKINNLTSGRWLHIDGIGLRRT